MKTNMLTTTSKSVWLPTAMLPATGIEGLKVKPFMSGRPLNEKQSDAGTQQGLQLLLLDDAYRDGDQEVAVMVVHGSDARSNHAYAFELHRCLLQLGLNAVMHLDDEADVNPDRTAVKYRATVISIDWYHKVALENAVLQTLTSDIPALKMSEQRGREPSDKILFDVGTIEQLMHWGQQRPWIDHLLPRSRIFLFTDFACVTHCSFLYGVQFKLHFHTTFSRDAALRNVSRKHLRQELPRFAKPYSEDLRLGASSDEKHTYTWDSPHTLMLRAHWNSKAAVQELTTALEAICYF